MTSFPLSCLRGPLAAMTTLAMAVLVTPAFASPMVTNGSFSTSGGNGQINYNTTLAGWGGTGYNFLYTPGTADTSGANGDSGNVALWGPGNGVANGLGPSPDGGNFVSLDGVYQPGAITQMITGLTAGQAATVSFYYAGAQQEGFNGATTEGLIVSLGGQSIAAPTLSNTNHGFTGWKLETLTFTPTGTSELLSFLATGTPPNGVPPFTLLDGVSISQTPEPGSLVLLATGLVGAGGMLRRRFVKKA